VPPSPLDIKESELLTSRDSHYFEAVARLKPGVTPAQAQQDLRAIQARSLTDPQGRDGGRDIQLVSVREDLVGASRKALLVIQGAVGLVLLVACANVSSLLIARATRRRRELTIRAALGATRGNLVVQLMTESAALGIAGGVLGLVISSWLVSALVGAMPDGLPRIRSVSIDTTVMLVTLGVSLL